jgi:hypothetical protein
VAAEIFRVPCEGTFMVPLALATPAGTSAVEACRLVSSEVFQHRVKFGSLAEDPFGVIEYHVARVSQGHATRQPVQQINTASLLEI